MGPHVTGLLSGYMDGELSETERAAVDAHLPGCPECARHLEELRAVDAAARELPLVVPDGYFEGFRGRLRQRLDRERPARRRFAPAWTFAAAAAIVLALLTPRVLREPRARMPAAPEPNLAERGAAAYPPPPAPEKKAASSPTAPRSRPRAVSRPPAPPPAPPAAQKAAPPTTAGYAAAPMEADRIEDAPRPSARLEATEASPQSFEEQERKDEARRDKAVAGRRQGVSSSREARFGLLLRRPASSAAQARALREEWRAFARDEAAGPHADEARVRAIEAGAAAWRLGKEERDRDQALSDGREYLRQPQAPQADRVREVLRSLSP